MAVILAVWTLAIWIIIKHEAVGFFVSVAYVLLGLIGAAISWLLLWPVLRILIHAMENE